MMKHTVTLILIFLLFVLFSSQSYAQENVPPKNSNADSIAVVKTINDFVDAFSNLDWNRFTVFFADDATAFFPPSANSEVCVDTQCHLPS